MQFKWLEKWAEDGLISGEAKDKIYAGCYRIIKEASPLTSALKSELIAHPGRRAVAPQIVAKRILDNKNVLADSSEFKKVRDELSKDKIFSHDKERFKKRFKELTALSPSSARDKEKAKSILENEIEYVVGMICTKLGRKSLCRKWQEPPKILQCLDAISKRAIRRNRCAYGWPCFYQLSLSFTQHVDKLELTRSVKRRNGIHVYHQCPSFDQ